MLLTVSLCDIIPLSTRVHVYLPRAVMQLQSNSCMHTITHTHTHTYNLRTHIHTHTHIHQMRYRETQKLQKQRDAESEKTEKSLDESGVKKLKGDSSKYLMSVDFCVLLSYKYNCDRITYFSMLCLFSERLQLIDTTLLKCYIKVCL